MGTLLVATGLGVAIIWWPRFWLAAPFGLLWLLFLALIGWAARQKYVLFVPLRHEETLPQANSLPALRAEELVPVRASGWFTVEGKDQYYVDVEADFETVRTREHIILGRVHPSRFLLVGSWPEWELGWWYIFFQPKTILEMSLGQLQAGRGVRLALRVVYATNEQGQQTIFLACDDLDAMRRIWDDLLRDAPPGVTGSTERLVEG
jgi:hypothetical protein